MRWGRICPLGTGCCSVPFDTVEEEDQAEFERVVAAESGVELGSDVGHCGEQIGRDRLVDVRCGAPDGALGLAGSDRGGAEDVDEQGLECGHGVALGKACLEQQRDGPVGHFHGARALQRAAESFPGDGGVPNPRLVELAR